MSGSAAFLSFRNIFCVSFFISGSRSFWRSPSFFFFRAARAAWKHAPLPFSSLPRLRPFPAPGLCGVPESARPKRGPLSKCTHKVQTWYGWVRTSVFDEGLFPRVLPRSGDASFPARSPPPTTRWETYHISGLPRRYSPRSARPAAGTRASRLNPSL